MGRFTRCVAAGGRRGLLVGAAALCTFVSLAGPATAASDAGARPSGVPVWVPLVIDHPTPSTTPLSPALTAPSTVRDTVVTPAQANAILSAVWTLRNTAFASNDRSLMAEFETGPALEADEVTCGCNSRAVRGPDDGQSLFVRKQRTFPATFLAEVKTTLSGAPYLQYLVIARHSLATPWQVVADPGESGTRALDRPKLGPGGFDVAAAASPGARNLPSEFASYWHVWTEDDHAPEHSDFAAGEWTTKAGAAYAKDPSGAWSSQNDLQGYYNFQSGAHDEEWSFGTATGAVTCGVVRWQTIWTYPGAGISQDPAQNNWGPSITPGNYEYEAETQIMQPCFIQRPGARIEVASGQGDPDTEQALEPLPAMPTPISPLNPATPTTTPLPPVAQA